MFNAIRRAVRAYVIRKLAEEVLADVVQNGLTQEDQAIIDDLMAAQAPV